jgi:hypothetical protein
MSHGVLMMMSGSIFKLLGKAIVFTFRVMDAASTYMKYAIPSRSKLADKK